MVEFGDESMLPEAPVKTSTESAFTNILKSSMERSAATQRALDARKNQLLNLSQQRMFNPTLMKFAGGMLAPTKTGSFGESLGYAANAASDEQEKEFARQQALEKLQYELDIESAKQQGTAAIPKLLMQMQQERAQPMQAKVPVAQPTGQPEAKPAPAQPSSQPTKARGTGGLLPNIPDEQLAIMAMDPNLAPLAKAEMDLREQRRKGRAELVIAGEKRFLYPEEIQEMQDLADRGDYEGLKAFYRRMNVPFNYIEDKNVLGGMRLPTAAEQEALKSKGVEAEKAKYSEQKEYTVTYAGGTRKFPFTPAQYLEYMDADSKGQGDAFINKMFKIKGTGTTTSGTTTTEGAYPKSKSEEAIEQAQETERGKKRVEASEAAREALFGGARVARGTIANADQIISLATNPKTNQVFGVFKKGDIYSALGTLVTEGAKAGNYSISIPAVETAFREAGATEQEIKASAVAAQAFAQNELNFRRIFLSGQGSVSNMEGAVIPRMSGSLSDSAGAAIAKSEVIKARAELDAAAARVLREWERRPENAKKNFSDFEDSREYSRLLDGYDAKLKKIMEVHFPGEKIDAKRNRPVGSASSSKSSAPSDVSLQQNQPPGVDRKNKWLK